MDETWGSFLSVVAQFIQGGKPKNVQVKDGYCFVPPELEVGAFELCLRGDDGESVVASVNRLTFEVCEGFDPSGETPLPPSPDLYTQLIKEIDSGKKIAQSVREDADAGLFNGKQGADGGWYTPSVTQPNENTLRMAFTPSKDGMPDVAHTDITLPGGGGGTSDHSKLSNRDAADQHPMSAITGLVDELAGKQPTGNYLTSEQDPTVPDWAKEENKPSYTAAEVGADPSGTATSKVSAHNTGTDTHSDIRLLIHGLSERLSAVADSDDTTLDQLSEVVAYIKSNRDLISAITTSKVSVADIIDNLTTNVTNKPLSAAQGVALKAMIDAITIPTALPNPNALTFTGAVIGSYDGSAPLEVAIPSGEGGTGGGDDVFELIGEATSFGVSDIVGLTIPFDGSLYKTIIAYAYNLPAGNKKRIIIRKNKAWYDGSPLGWNGAKDTYLDSMTKMNNTWGLFGAAIDVGGKLFTLGAAEANANAGHGYFRFWPQNGELPTLNLSNCKYISLDCNSNSEILPDGCSLIVWGVRK